MKPTLAPPSSGAWTPRVIPRALGSVLTEVSEVAEFFGPHMYFKSETILSQIPVLLQAGTGIDIAAGAKQGSGWDIVSNVLIGFVVLAAVVLVGYFAVKIYRARAASASPNRVEPIDSLARATRARVKKAMARGDYEVAGDILAHAGMHREAADAYSDADAFEKAARSFQVQGNTQKAIHYYKRAGDFEMTARLYVESGEHRA